MLTSVQFESIKQIGTERLDEEIISPEKYLNLTQEEKQEIATAVPFVKPMGENDLDNPNFVGIKIRYKNPRYIIKF